MCGGIELLIIFAAGFICYQILYFITKRIEKNENSKKRKRN